MDSNLPIPSTNSCKEQDFCATLQAWEHSFLHTISQGSLSFSGQFCFLFQKNIITFIRLWSFNFQFLFIFFKLTFKIFVKRQNILNHTSIQEYRFFQVFTHNQLISIFSQIPDLKHSLKLIRGCFARQLARTSIYTSNLIN